MNEDAIRELRQAMQNVVDVALDIAHAKMALYKAYLSEGFTEVQALELVKQFQ